MSYISPRSLQLLKDIVDEDTQQGEYEEPHVEQTSQSTADNTCRVADDTCREENMNGEEQDFKETLNFFEKLERENGSIGLVNGFLTRNGVKKDTAQGTAEESEEESYTVTEVSETTADDSNQDNDSNPTKVFKKTQHHSKKVITEHRDRNHNYKPAKASSVRDNSTDRDSLSEAVETMSDSGRIGRRQRKLNKRAQIRPLGLEPLETAEERLEKKYDELEQLLSGQFLEQKRALSINHIQQMELLRQQYAIASHGLPPTGVLVPRSMPSRYRNSARNRHTGGDKENVQHPVIEDEAYTTIRTLQATQSGQRRSRTRSSRTRPLSATRHNQSRSASRERRERTPEKENRQHSNDRSKERGRRGTKARSRSNSRSRSSSESPRRTYVPTETHLKNTDNEIVREWAKKKEIELRRRKAEERKKKRLERQQMIEKEIEREEKYRDSKKIVQRWMRQKQKEAYRKKREEQNKVKDEAARKAYERAKYVSGIHGLGCDRPLSAPAPHKTNRSKIRVSRPGTTVEEVQAKEEQKARETTLSGDDSGQQEIPQPPVTKYVYRRPVLGKVRLRMKTPQPQEDSKPVPVKKSVEKTLSKEEIEKKQRMSYDEWLHHKRKEDEEKKKEMQKEQAQSEAEYKTPVPDLVQNGQGNILRGKGIPGIPPAKPHYVSRVISQEERERIREMAFKKKQKVVGSMEEEVDTTYDERSESPEEAIQRVAKNVVNYVLRSLSDEEAEDDLFEDDDETEHEGLANLGVFGSKASLSSKSRPMSASAARVPGPQSSKSPRRPFSAQPKPKPVSREAVSGTLPFPSDIGAPPHVQKVQKKLFGDRPWVNPEGEERPEPQGSDSEHNGLMEAQDQSPLQEMDNTEDLTNEDNLSSSKKHVSFSEETTVFDESDVEEDFGEWMDADPGQDSSDVEKIRKLFLEENPEDAEAGSGIFLTTTADVHSDQESTSC